MRTVLIDELIAWEVERFQANEYRGRSDAPEFEFAGGRIPALVSAPHAVTHMRDGMIKPSEDFMGAIALAVAHAAECHALVATRTGDGDPNWDPFEQSLYKQALCKYVAEYGFKLVLDLHGMVAASADSDTRGAYTLSLRCSDDETLFVRFELKPQSFGAPCAHVIDSGGFAFDHAKLVADAYLKVTRGNEV